MWLRALKSWPWSLNNVVTLTIPKGQEWTFTLKYNFTTYLYLCYPWVNNLHALMSVYIAWHLPCDIQGSLNFGLYGAQQVSSHLLQQLCEQDEQPVLQILLMDMDEIYQCLQEHAEHLHTHTQFGSDSVIHSTIHVSCTHASSHVFRG